MKQDKSASDTAVASSETWTPGLRKPLILGLIVFCLLLIIWAVFESLLGPTKKNTHPAITPSQGPYVAPDKFLAHLPDNYNSDQMSHFFKKNKPNHHNAQIDLLKQQLTALQSNYDTLQSEFTRLNQQPPSPPPEPTNNDNANATVDNFNMQRALQSSILVGALRSIPDTKQILDEKNKAKQNDIEEAKIQYPKSTNELMAGSSIPAVLQTEVVSDVPGIVVGIVRQNVYDSIHGVHILIPKGSKLIGSYGSNITYGQNSLQVGFHRLIRPDGSSIDLSKFPGIGPLGTSGMTESVNHHWGVLAGAALLSSIFSIPSILASNTQYASSCIQTDAGIVCNNNNTQNNTRNSALQSLGQTASELGTRLTSRALSLKPTVIIHPGYTFSVLVTKDVTLPPYEKEQATSS